MPKRLEFEWPNGRAPLHKTIITVHAIRKPNLLQSVTRSPSISKLPNPITIEAKVYLSNHFVSGETIHLTLPEAEVTPLIEGQLLAIGTQKAPVCTQVTLVPADASDHALWLEHWDGQITSND
ncbi:hypothetical protein [Pleionea sp. CnH1-48]|uniref:hypothetical protein n=1 Tax=Pleionea sp. CnH1-48 TaxID=2954494 RepID=UPI0020982EC7|nr:hypothetical protein [Pleionea sp. CnH1-48]MCO7224080.1 hypothetical protein [Pleionea sp. CnH1-48]